MALSPLEHSFLPGEQMSGFSGERELTWAGPAKPRESEDIGSFKKPSAQHDAQFIAHAGHKTDAHTLSYGREALFPEAKTNITSLNYLTKVLV